MKKRLLFNSILDMCVKGNNGGVIVGFRMANNILDTKYEVSDLFLGQL